MRCKVFSIKSLLIGAVVAMVPLVLPATASAYGWYHYLAWDTYYKDVWPSNEPIARMYWHHTAGGFGASIKCKIDGKDFGWIWVPVKHNGWGGFTGTITKDGYELSVLVVRFNGQSGAFVPEPIYDAYAWSANAYVSIVATKGTEYKFAEGVLHQNLGDQLWE